MEAVISISPPAGASKLVFWVSIRPEVQAPPLSIGLITRCPAPSW
jgi:hypothetical protein